MRLFAVAVATLACSIGSLHADETCLNGTAYKVSTTGETVVVKRSGIGESVFSPGDKPQTGMALDLVTQTGERGAIFGPMRSYMFATDPETLTKHGYQWSPASPDPDGFYRVMSDDGQNELFTLSYLGCAD
jgi:hypothetical protein